MQRAARYVLRSKSGDPRTPDPKIREGFGTVQIQQNQGEMLFYLEARVGIGAAPQIDSM
jgi:hypothetical protein